MSYINLITEDGLGITDEVSNLLVIEYATTDTTIAVDGRQGIGVAQPQSGTDFPLVEPSTDVRYLLADLHITFDQPSDYSDAVAFQPPFRIQWLSGFGTVPPSFPIPTLDGSNSWNSVCNSETSSASGQSVSVVDCLPLPKHDHDIIVVDANDRVVFDSTDPFVTYETRAWGTRLQVVVWRHPTDQIVSLVYHTAWNPDNEPPQQEYSSYFFPTTAVIDERAVVRLPKRLRSLTVVLDNLRKTGVELAAGYNMQLVTGNSTNTDGKRHSTRITFNAAAGAGLGVFPDCTPDTLQITTVNGVGPTKTGDFFLSATDCYWIRQPTRVLDNGQYPEINLLPGSIPTAELPSLLAGTTKSAPGWPQNDDPRYAHLQFGNDCGPCCDCPDYVDAATYLNNVRNQYQRTGKHFEGVRDLYHINRERWQTTLSCINRRPLRLRLLPQLCPFLDVSAQFCNQTGKCLSNIGLTVAFTTTPDTAVATEMLGFTFITGARTRPGSITPITDRYTMGGEYPTFTAFFDVVQPGQSVHARFRLKFSDCGVGDSVPYAVTGELTATVDGQPLTVNDLSVPPLVEPATAIDTQTLNCPGLDTTLNYLACACER